MRLRGPKMNVGLIGCGRVAELHMCAYKHIPEANVVAVSDVNIEKAKAFAQKYRVNKTFKDYLELLEIKNLDLVSICTPTSTHAEIACDAAKLGKNILLEKPMARSTAECDRIIQEASKHGVKLSISHNQLFLPPVMQAKAIVDSGEFDLSYFRVSVRESAELIRAPSWTIAPEQGGIIWETGCHSAYLQLHFLKDINKISAIGEKIKHPVYDQFIALLRAQNQAIGVIEVSWLAKKLEIIFELVSSDGKQMEILNYNFFMKYPGKHPRRFLQGFYWDLKAIIKKWAKFELNCIHYRHVLRGLPQYILINKYIDSIKTDLDPPVKPEDGRNSIALLECIEQSLNKNQPVKMNRSAH
jgi:UDP-N-acetyl-2-amino-2-deoxyglucuronate dehydrogenase